MDIGLLERGRNSRCWFLGSRAVVWSYTLRRGWLLRFGRHIGTGYASVEVEGLAGYVEVKQNSLISNESLNNSRRQWARENGDSSYAISDETKKDLLLLKLLD